MSRSLFLLIVGGYNALLGLSMIFLAEPSLNSYGVPTVDLAHISVMQYLGVSTGGIGLLAFLNRNAPNSVSLRNALLMLAVTGFGGIAKGLYDIFVLHPPMSAFFVGDTVFRLALSIGFVYFYNQETKLAQAGQVLA
jgi:hypothetical protein